MTTSAVVTSTSSTYNGVTVYESQIYDMVGMDTYGALYYLSPDLYFEINYPMPVKQYAIENVQAVQVNSGYTYKEIKQALVQSYVTGENDPNILPLINSSPPASSWDSDFFSSAWFILILSLGILSFAWIVVYYLIKPLVVDYI